MQHLTTPLFDPPRRSAGAKRPTWRGLRWLTTLLLGALFVYAGVIKVMDPRRFQVSIGSYQFDWLVEPMPGLVALVLPWLEITCGAALGLRLIGLRGLHRGALLMISGFSLFFLGAVISTCARGLEVGCGCFGDSITLSCPAHILLNSLMVLAAFWLLATDRRPRKHRGLILRT